MRIAKEGLVFILPSLALASLGFAAGWWPAGVLFGLFTAAFLFFFRNPGRTVPAGDALIVAPADGKVLRIDPVPAHPDIPGPATRICIFLSLTDVHLTRSPISGTMARVDYHPGKFFPAYRDEASDLNESNSLYIRGDRVALALKQIVGVAARRIKCFVKTGDRVERGAIIGLMYFGSRVEVTFPPGVLIKAAVGQKVRAGETVIAEVNP